MTVAAPRPTRFVLIAAVLLALACGGMLSWIARHSDGLDWPLSEFQATLAYSALVQYHELPFFSYFVNGGQHQMQDPQGIMLSPTLAWVVLCGPCSGLRMAPWLYAGVGFLSFWWWLRRYVCDGAALLAAAAWLLSLGFFWRLAVGNDMFMWHALLPLVLLVIERLLERPTWRAALAAGAVFSVIGLSPTFHSLLYLLIPAGFLWSIITLAGLGYRRMLSARHGVRLLLWGTAALLVAVIICLPRLYLWRMIPMHRSVWFDGVLRWKAAVRCLLDARYVAKEWLPRSCSTSWGVWESAVALPFVATFCAGIGLLLGARWRPRLWLYALVLIGAGIAIAINAPLYSAFFNYFHGSFRVPDRFLMLASFGVAVLAALGADAVCRRLPRGAAHIAMAILIAAVLFNAWWWQQAAWRAQTLAARVPLVQHPALLHQGGTNSLAARGYCATPVFDGAMVIREFPVLGAEWNTCYASAMHAAGVAGQPIITSAIPVRVALSHRRVRIHDLPPGAEIYLRLMPSILGERLQVEPADADVTLLKRPYDMRVRNSGAKTATLVELAPVLPPPWQFRRGDRIPPNAHVIHDTGLLANGTFDDGVAKWSPWGATASATGAVRMIATLTCAGMRHAVRIENPHRKLLGLQQCVQLRSNVIYRLSAAARSSATTSADIIFGGRLALWLPPQPELQIVWMSEYNDWWQKSLVFTNTVTGTAVVYVHLGYGNVASTGEFTNISLEALD